MSSWRLPYLWKPHNHPSPNRGSRKFPSYRAKLALAPRLQAQTRPWAWLAATSACCPSTVQCQPGLWPPLLGSVIHVCSSIFLGPLCTTGHIQPLDSEIHYNKTTHTHTQATPPVSCSCLLKDKEANTEMGRDIPRYTVPGSRWL